MLGLSEAAVQQARVLDVVRQFTLLLAPKDGSVSIFLQAAGTREAKQFLECWESRLAELAGVDDPDVREAVAQALVAWKQLSVVNPALGFSEKQLAMIQQLAKDPRARVRKAAQN